VTESSWVEHGYLDLGHPVDGSTWAALEAEALAWQSTAKLEEHSRVSALRDGSFRSPARFENIGGGPTLLGLLRSRELLAAARAATGIASLVPVRCSYNYYRQGSYIGVHRDSLKCTLTITFGLTDGIPPMDWAPSLRGATNDEVGELVRTRGHFPEGFERLGVLARGLRGFDGYNIPHWRRPYPAESAILANLCYFEL
jgi:hypothetical protein